MTEYDYSPEAAEAFHRKLRGVGKWAQDTSRYNGDFTSPFEHTPSAARRQLDNGSSTSSSGSDSDSGFTSYSRRRSRPVYPKSLTQWPGPRSRAPPPRPLQLPHQSSPPLLGQRPPPTRSHTLPNQIYVQNTSPAVQQTQPQYPYPAQRPVVYYPTQQPVIPQQQQQTYASPYYVPPVPKRSNTTPSKPLSYQYYSTPVNSAGASPYATPASSPYASATYPSQPTSPRGPGKNWLSRMFGALSIRGRSASPAPMSHNSGGQLNYEPTMRHARSRSLGPTGYAMDRERDKERESTKSGRTRRSRSTRSTRPSHPRERYSEDSDRDRRRHRDRSRERDRDRGRNHQRVRSVGHR